MSSISIPAASPSPRWMHVAVVALLLPHLVGFWYLFPRYAFTQGDTGVRLFAVAAAVSALAAVVGMWLQRPWGPWLALAAISHKATIDLFGWSIDFDRFVMPFSGLLLVIAVLIFRIGAPTSATVTLPQRILFGFVLAFAAWVAVWGLFFPAIVDRALPFMVPPLHARFLGAMYLSGATFMGLAMVARTWSDIRVVTVILAVWTGMLGIVSLFHLDAFKWTHQPVWFWFVAYIGYPLIALWVAWCQRSVTGHPAEPPVSAALRAYLRLQGGVATLLAVALLVAPTAMTTLWPWAIPPVLAQIYGAPFLAYGIGSLHAAQQQSWSEVRITVYGTLVFAVAVLTASLLHRGVFGPANPSTWLWFGGLAVVVAALGAFALVSSLRVAGPTRGTT